GGDDGRAGAYGCQHPRHGGGHRPGGQLCARGCGPDDACNAPRESAMSARLGRRVRAAVELFGVFVYDLLASSFTVAGIVLTPDRPRKPVIVAIPVDARTEWGVALFAYLASLTPGSTALHVSDDHRT